MTYFVYILRCADGTLYTGIAKDVARRVAEHNGKGRKGKGAKYTASRRPVNLVYQAHFVTRSAALKEEVKIKKLSRSAKLKMISYIKRQAIASDTN